MLKEMVRAWGLDPERVLVREALIEPQYSPFARSSKRRRRKAGEDPGEQPI